MAAGRARSQMVTQVLQESCTHQWSLPSPNGPTTLGRCTDCGAEKVFRNSFQDMERTNNSDIFGAAPRRNGARVDPASDTSDYDLELALGSMRGLRSFR